jgi:hypothetical protein
LPNLTANLGLKKPLDTETADIAIINENMDKIDAAMYDKFQLVDTAGTGLAYTINIPGITNLSQLIGFPLIVKFTLENTGQSTLNINNLGAKSLIRDISSLLQAGYIVANKILIVVYDGTYYKLITPGAFMTQPKIALGDAIRDLNDKKLLGFTGYSTPVNYLNITNANTGYPVNAMAMGTDANIDINLIPKGTGVLKVDSKEVALKETLDAHTADNATQLALKATKTWSGGSATLQNGWVGTIIYEKNDLGIVFVKGLALGTGTIAVNTIIANMPAGFRPALNASVFAKVLKGNVSPYDDVHGFLLNSSGNIVIRNSLPSGLTANVPGASLSFTMIYKAEL